MQTKMFRIYTIDAAPEKSKQALQGLQNAFGLIPNLAATMAGNPVLVNAFVGAFGSFHGGTLSESEKQVLLLTNAITLKCTWTAAFHSTLALKSGVVQADVDAIRARELPSDPKFAALATLTGALIEERGHNADAEVAKFLAAGYSEAQILEVIAGIAISTMAATTGNLADTPVEDPFKAQTWTPA